MVDETLENRGTQGSGEEADKLSPEDEKAFEKFRTCAVDVLQVPAEKVVLSASFGEDLEADSLDLVELVMALEEAFEITVEEEELDGVETVGQAFRLVTSKAPEES
jgi:acyl carrier protein